MKRTIKGESSREACASKKTTRQIDGLASYRHARTHVANPLSLIRRANSIKKDEFGYFFLFSFFDEWMTGKRLPRRMVWSAHTHARAHTDKLLTRQEKWHTHNTHRSDQQP